MTHLLLSYGLVLLFFAIAIESAGIPLPGETALVTAAVLSASGRLHHSIVLVVAVAAAAAIVGDNVGYWIGREGGRQLLGRWGPIARHAEKVLPPAERFFERHGSKTVFIGRFIAVLRVTAAWLAGISRMPWWKFFAWNAAGGICWATLVGVVAYYAGKAAAEAIGRYGLYAVGGLAVVAVVGFFAVRFWRKRMAESM
ncbi:MAG TPA: DedA family protein [Gaiellaceae bacterium]|nr:DedA family protein [Gaiellaceae bacterium]